MKTENSKIQHGNKQCQALDKSRNYAIITITHNFLKKHTVLAQHELIIFVYIYGLYSTETQSNILIIVILLQPKLEIDISTWAPAPVGQKQPELWHVFFFRGISRGLATYLPFMTPNPHIYPGWGL